MSIASGKHPTPGALVRWSWEWLQTHEKIRWALAFIVVCTICYQINMGPVWAAPDDAPSASTLFLPLSGVTDTHGVPIMRYTELPMDPGNQTHIFRSVRYALASIFWVIYMIPVLLVISMVDWVLKFEWLEWMAAPFVTVTNGVTDFLDTWMLIPLGLLISALIIGFGYVRGRMGAATVEFVMVVLVFGLIASPVANPLTWIAGTSSDISSSNGLIQKAAETGELAGGVTINKEASPENTSVAASIIDVTLRRPALTMSFGSALSGDCEAAWDDKASDPSLTPDDIRKEVIKCSDDVAKANQTDSYMWMTHYVMAWPAMIGVMFLIAVFLGFMLYQVVQVLIGSVVAVIRGFMAVFPGSSRQAWFNSLFQVIISALLVGVYIWALTVYMWVMTQIISSIPPALIQIGSILTGLLVLIMTFTFWKMKKSGKKIGERIARALGRNGLAKNAPEQQPSKFGSTAGNLAKSAVSQQMRANRSRKLIAATRAAKAAAVAGTGGAAAVAAKVGTGLVAKSASSQALKAVSGKQERLAIESNAGGASAMNGPQPSADPNPPAGAENVAPTALSRRDHAPAGVPDEGFSSMPRSDSNGVGEGTSGAARNAASSGRTSRIPEGNYGGTWVHKNGQTHRPVTVTQDGKQVRNIPSEEKVARGLRKGDTWVISPNVGSRQDTSRGVNTPMEHSSAARSHNVSPARHSVQTPSPMKSPAQQPAPARQAPANTSRAATDAAPQTPSGQAQPLRTNLPADYPRQTPKPMKPRQGGQD